MADQELRQILKDAHAREGARELPDENESTTNGVPPRIVEALRLYGSMHYSVGDFLTAVLRNDLVEACGRADDVNCRLLPEIVRFCYCALPGNSWGSPEKVKDWLAKRVERPEKIAGRFTNGGGM
jgi:hypothetical protein